MDPYKITEQTCVSFSGGRSSAYMLKKIIDSNNGIPDDCKVCFANTGKEMEETLEFVNECSKQWDVEIVWLEYKENEIQKERFKIVDFETASRNGEPFFDSINQNGKPYLPNPVARICTINMKIRTIHNYLKSIGWKHNERMDWVGIRADEPRRIAKIGRERTPLATDNVTKEIVGKFWKENSFDLKLPNNNGVTMHGNCDLCFLKPAHQIQSLIAEDPKRADWWIKMEAHVKSSNSIIGQGGVFRKDRPPYKEMKKYALAQTDIFNQDEQSISCFCGD